MPREGRSLELMVKRLHEFLVPYGITVQSPEEFFHPVTKKKIGEIDITLCGNLGASKIFIGIECRDRPADGEQGIPWIREIHGKKDDIGVTQMIAVSSTGFKPEAVDLANRFRIDLLKIEDFDNVNPEGWFQAVTLVWHQEQWNLAGTIDIETIPRIAPHTSSMTRGAFLLRKNEGDLFVPLGDFYDWS